MDNLHVKKPNAKLSGLDVVHIKQMLDAGSSPRDLAWSYKVSVETIRRIKRGDTWTQTTHAKAEPSPEEKAKARAELFASIPKELRADDIIPPEEWEPHEVVTASRGVKPRYSWRLPEVEGLGNKHKAYPAAETVTIPPNPMEYPDTVEVQESFKLPDVKE